MNKTILLLSTMALLVSSHAAEDDGNGKAANHKPAPFPNYWDANSWEAGSGKSFWKSVSGGAQTPTETKQAKSIQSTSEKGFFDRQTEK